MVMTVERSDIHSVLISTSAYAGFKSWRYASSENSFTTPPYKPFFKKLYKMMMTTGATKKTVNHMPMGHAYSKPILFRF